MPILFVNGKRRGIRVRGRAVIGRSRGRSNPTNPTSPTQRAFKKRFSDRLARERRARSAVPRKRVWMTPYKKGVPLPFLAAYRAKPKRNPGRRRRQPAALAKYWAKRRSVRRNPARRRARGGARARAHDKGFAALAAYNRKRGRRARRRTSMAKGSRKRSLAMKRVWRARKAAGKVGRLGRTKRRRRTHAKRRRARHVVAAPIKRRRRSRKRRTHAAPKRRRARRSRRRRARRSSRTRRTRMRRKMTRRTRRTRRLTPGQMHMMMTTRRMTHNPGRRRRRRRRSTHSRARRSRRRYRRGFRRNPGGMIMDLAKKAIPVLLGMVGSGALVSTIGPMIPGVAALGSLQAPVLSIGALLGANFATKKVAFLAKHREPLMIGAGLNVLKTFIAAFAPASVKQLVGMGDYVQMGDYIAVGATPLDDQMTLSDYVAVGGDGVQEELGLGLEEELGVDEELGASDIGGVMGGGSSLLKPVPPQSFLKQIPARSFTKQIPAATTAYDNPGQLYGGIFNGGFGR